MKTECEENAVLHEVNQWTHKVSNDESIFPWLKFHLATTLALWVECITDFVSIQCLFNDFDSVPLSRDFNIYLGDAQTAYAEKNGLRPTIDY
jgi:hypothetical protein